MVWGRGWTVVCGVGRVLDCCLWCGLGGWIVVCGVG